MNTPEPCDKCKHLYMAECKLKREMGDAYCPCYALNLGITESPEQFRTRVVEAAKEILEKYEWFDGVCIDNTNEYYPDRFDAAVDNAVDQTWYWDGPLED